MVEAERVVSIGFLGVEDSDRDGVTVMESVIVRSSPARVAIGGERIGAERRVLVEDRAMER